jgi:hypothetical protein
VCFLKFDSEESKKKLRKRTMTATTTSSASTWEADVPLRIGHYWVQTLSSAHALGAESRWGTNRFIADQFARSGIAALVYDKRGSGVSTGDWKASSYDDLANDVLAGIDLGVGLPWANVAASTFSSISVSSAHTGKSDEVRGGGSCTGPVEVNREPLSSKVRHEAHHQGGDMGKLYAMTPEELAWRRRTQGKAQQQTQQQTMCGRRFKLERTQLAPQPGTSSMAAN